MYHIDKSLSELFSLINDAIIHNIHDSIHRKVISGSTEIKIILKHKMQRSLRFQH